jgi:hypothetical protein
MEWMERSLHVTSVILLSHPEFLLGVLRSLWLKECQTISKSFCQKNQISVAWLRRATEIWFFILLCVPSASTISYLYVWFITF